MSESPGLEPFPALSPRSYFQRKDSSNSVGSATAPRPGRRRKSSNQLPGEPRGDTGAVAFSTLGLNIPPPGPGAATLTRTASEKARPHSKRRKARSLLRRWMSFSLRHTWVNPLVLVLTVLALYVVNPTTENPLHSAIFLSYPLPRKLGDDSSKPIQYAKGGRDFIFVGFYTIVLSFAREFIMQRVIQPIARRAHIRNKDKQARFMEQFYTAIYFGIFGPYGLYVMSRTPLWYFKTEPMFEHFPHKTHDAMFKAYYLLQAAYWAQQAIVLLLQLEKPRKDFYELVGHHIVTIALIWCSYRFHFTYMGIAVFITMDVSDFFLATSKVFNYLDLPIVGPYFGFFICVWAYCRHYLNLKILWATLTTFRTIGPFELNWETQQYKCLLSQTITFALLASLQAVNIFWFVLILRIAVNFISTKEGVDERSEYGDSEDEDDQETTAQKKARMEDKTKNATANKLNSGPQVLLNGQPVSESTGTESVDLIGSQRRKGR